MKRHRTAKRTGTRPARGRPPVHTEAWSKVSVVLFDRQIVQLDRYRTVRRGQPGKGLNRAEIIRALVDALIASRIDVRSAGSEADLRKEIARRLSARR